MPHALSEFTAYNPIYDAEITRLSLTNDEGLEYYALLRRENGKAWRERRAKAIDQMLDAMTPVSEGGLGLPPGQVDVGD